MFIFLDFIWINTFYINRRIVSIDHVSDTTDYLSFNKQPCMTRPTIINLNPGEYNQGFCSSPFTVNLESCIRIFNILNDPSNKICVPNKTENVNLSVFSMITRVNESKLLARHISCDCKNKFEGKKCKSIQKWNKNKCRCANKNLKKHYVCKKRLYLVS